MSDNLDLPAKVAVRRQALAWAGGKAARVLELFGGHGVMYDACYKSVAAHLAFDLKGVERGTWLQGDNRVLIQKHVNDWTLYDADAYSNPWLILTDICRLRAPGDFAMVATCYHKKTLDFSNPDQFFRWVTGYGTLPGSRSKPNKLCGGMLGRYYDDFIGLVFAKWKTYGVTLTAAKRVRAGLHVHYYALNACKTSN